jgi:nitroreductase
MLKDLLRAALDRIDGLLLPIAGRSSWLASLYYLVFSRAFGREHWAVLAGRLAYSRLGAAANLVSSPLLRRNVHRLEKGLVMQPRQRIFAEDYIEETVAEFARLAACGGLDADEAQWAHDVLAGYFGVVDDTPRISAARRRFAGVRAALRVPGGSPSVPAPRSAGVQSAVGFDDFMQLCRQRRSVRWFEQRPVPRELVERALAAAAQAPSACNRQPFLFRYFGLPADAQRIAGLAMGTTGYAQNIPALAVVLGDLSCYPEERDRHVPYIDASLAAMQFMLALETLGLASCAINWPDIEFRERLMERELSLPRHLRPVMLIALGYPDPQGGVPFSAKKPVAALLRLDNDYAP